MERAIQNFRRTKIIFVMSDRREIVARELFC